MITSKILKFVISFFVCVSVLSCAKNKEIYPCSILEFKSSFALEVSQELRSMDDMIFRTPAFFLSEGKKIKYRDGIFLFEQRCFEEDDCPSLYSSEGVKYFNSALNDSVHMQLNGLNANYISKNSTEFKLFDLSIKALYLGKKKNMIYKNGKYRYKKIKTYLIVDFQQIRAL